MGLRELGQNLRRVGHNILYGSSSDGLSTIPLLPYSVRLALAEQGGQMTATHIKAIATTAPAFMSAAYYLLIKGLDNGQLSDKERIRDILVEGSVASRGNDAEYTKSLAVIVEKYLPNLDPERRIKGAKLAQISRYGPDTWSDRFRGLADYWRREGAQVTPALMAYSTLTGIEHFFRASRELGAPFDLLIQDWIDNRADKFCGYRINSADNSVKYLPKRYPRPDNYLIFDDTMRTGEHIRKIETFWAIGSSNGPLNMDRVTFACVVDCNPMDRVLALPIHAIVFRP